MIKKTQLIIILFFVNSIILFSNTIPEYKMKLVKTFPSGKNNNELGNNKGGPQECASAITFDNNGNLYISDIFNYRLMKYDHNLNFIKSFTNCYSFNAKQLLIDNDNNIISFNSGAIRIDDKLGNKKIEIKLKNSKYKKKVRSKPSFLLHDDNIYIYLKNNDLISIEKPTIKSDDNIKKIKDHKETLELLNKSRSNIISIDEKNRIILNGNIATNDFTMFHEYKKEIRTKQGTRNNHIRGITDKQLSETYNTTFIGKDIDSNLYWDVAGNFILVLNNTGNVIAEFKYKDTKSDVLPTVHPSGDIYFLGYDGKLNYLYKISRKW